MAGETGAKPDRWGAPKCWQSAGTGSDDRADDELPSVCGDDNPPGVIFATTVAHPIDKVITIDGDCTRKRRGTGKPAVRGGREVGRHEGGDRVPERSCHGADDMSGRSRGTLSAGHYGFPDEGELAWQQCVR